MVLLINYTSGILLRGVGVVKTYSWVVGDVILRQAYDERQRKNQKLKVKSQSYR
jgi:hypothetical protein